MGAGEGTGVGPGDVPGVGDEVGAGEGNVVGSGVKTTRQMYADVLLEHGKSFHVSPLLKPGMAVGLSKVYESAASSNVHDPHVSPAPPLCVYRPIVLPTMRSGYLIRLCTTMEATGLLPLLPSLISSHWGPPVDAETHMLSVEPSIQLFAGYTESVVLIVALSGTTSVPPKS